MTDPRLLNLLDAAKVLDDPNVTAEQAAKVVQLCSILAQSLNPDALPVGDGAPDWPDPVIRVAFDLAMATSNYAHSLTCPDSAGWWHDYRAKMLADWGDARRAAELAARQEIQASTLNALAAAERRADEGTALVANDAAPLALLSRSDLSKADDWFERGDAGPAWSFD
jgi:hypothetical protein